MSDYKGFDINTPSTPPPWGAREQSMVQDVIDTSVGDCVSTAKDVTGHKHPKLYNMNSEIVANATSNDRLTLYSSGNPNSSIILSDHNGAIIRNVEPDGTNQLSMQNRQITLSATGSSNVVELLANGDNSSIILSTSGGSNTSIELNTNAVNCNAPLNMPINVPIHLGWNGDQLKYVASDNTVELVAENNVRLIAPNLLYLTAGQILIPADSAVAFGDTSTSMYRNGNDFHILAHSNLVLDNFHSQEYLFTDVNGIVHQGPLSVSASQTNVFLPQGDAMWFDNAGKTSIKSTNPMEMQLLAGSIGTSSNPTITLYGTTNTTSQSINLNAPGDSNNINLYANGSGGFINIVAGESINLTAGSAYGEIYMSGTIQHNGSEIGFFGKTPAVQPAVGASCGDSSTIGVLVDNIRTALISLGIAKT